MKIKNGKRHYLFTAKVINVIFKQKKTRKKQHGGYEWRVKFLLNFIFDANLCHNKYVLATFLYFKRTQIQIVFKACQTFAYKRNFFFKFSTDVKLIWYALFFCIQIFLCVCVCVLYWAPHMIVAFWIKQLFRIDSVQWSLVFIWMTCSIFFLAYACAWNVTFRTRSLDTF